MNKANSNKYASANERAKKGLRERRKNILARLEGAKGNRLRMTILTIGYQFWNA